MCIYIMYTAGICHILPLMPD